jgi:anaerobic magnesium-protoporphyrin IX monomethyl ester cyclase
MPNIEIDVLDCQAELIGWDDLKRRIESYEPDVVVSSALATCNTYTILRTLEIVKKIDPQIIAVVGGQHFTALATESLNNYHEIDYIIRGEGELTLLDLVLNLDDRRSTANVDGISFRQHDKLIHNPPRALIDKLDDLPFPGYHFIEDNNG